MDKKKITVDIAGTPITLITDEPEDFVRLVTDTVNDRMSEITKNSFRVSNLDAAILLAVDYLGDKLKAERRIRTLEAQLSLCEVNIENLENKLHEFESASDDGKGADASPKTDGEPCETIGSVISESDSHESRIRALENYLDSKKNGSSSPKTREEKIKYIESLLRGNNDK